MYAAIKKIIAMAGSITNLIIFFCLNLITSLLIFQRGLAGLALWDVKLHQSFH